jgi:hypothetical protein
MKARAVSIRADHLYIQALKVVAAQEDRPIADLVFEAIEARFGEKIAAQLSFFASNGNKKVQTDLEKSSEAV